jgi:hypothetical protein
MAMAYPLFMWNYHNTLGIILILQPCHSLTLPQSHSHSYFFSERERKGIASFLHILTQSRRQSLTFIHRQSAATDELSLELKASISFLSIDHYYDSLFVSIFLQTLKLLNKGKCISDCLISFCLLMNLIFNLVFNFNFPIALIKTKGDFWFLTFVNNTA